MKYTQRGRVTAFFLLMAWVNMSFGFVTVVNNVPAREQHTNNWSVKSLAAATTASDTVDADEVVARRIVVVGDVHGGYYRSCVRNEVFVVCCCQFYLFYLVESHNRTILAALPNNF